MEGLQATYDINGNNNGGWGNWGGALIGGAIGAWAGNNWGRGPNGGWGDHSQCVMDSLTTMRTDINSIGRDQLIQSNAVQGAMLNGFGQTNSVIERIGSDIARNQSRTEAAVYTTGLQGQIDAKNNTIAQLGATHANEVQSLRNTFEIVSSQKDCCCTTNRNIETQGCQTRETILSEGCATRASIHHEGEATRALIASLDRERLLRESAEKDAKIATLEAQRFNTDLALQQSAHLRAMEQRIIDRIPVVTP